MSIDYEIESKLMLLRCSMSIFIDISHIMLIITYIFIPKLTRDPLKKDCNDHPIICVHEMIISCINHALFPIMQQLGLDASI